MSHELDTHAPLILFIGGHDPTGGAGLQADLETAVAHGCTAISLVTCLTSQDSHDVQALYPQRPAQLRQQAEKLLADLRPKVLKIGLLGAPEIASMVAGVIQDLRLPVVLDPVLAAGGGASLSNAPLLNVIEEQLLPLTTLLTPNRAEARRLAHSENTGEAAQVLLQRGCGSVLITGADEAQGDRVVNRLYSSGDQVDFEWPRLPHTYHGSGCTLASACACELALGQTIEQAVRHAQQFTWQTLSDAQKIGSGQHFPNRRGRP